MAASALAMFVLALAIISVVAWLVANRFAGIGSSAAAIGVLAIGLMLAMMAGAMRRFILPLRQVMDAADRVAGGDYSTRVHESGPPPMRALARSFNTMTDRLQRADRLRRDLMADVAHELRTPLSVLQGRLEGLLDGVYARDDRQLGELLDETRVLQRLIDDLRTLALSDAGSLPLQKEPTDLGVLAQDMVRSMEPEAGRKGVGLSATTSAQNSAVDLDPFRIREVLTNLLTNAIRHTPAGGRVTLSVSETRDRASVTVADTGEGMSPDEVARMFDRFYKGAESRGSGLGLTIAKGIVTAHGGDISAQSEPGKGTTVTFTIPK
jgi:signal transduction histidine kinase